MRDNVGKFKRWNGKSGCVLKQELADVEGQVRTLHNHRVDMETYYRRLEEQHEGER